MEQWLVPLLQSIIVAIPATVGAWAALHAKRNSDTSNGHKLGELLEHHTAQDEANFQALHAEQAAQRQTLARLEGDNRA